MNINIYVATYTYYMYMYRRVRNSLRRCTCSLNEVVVGRGVHGR
jgi:hypothetical protein